MKKILTIQALLFAAALFAAPINCIDDHGQISGTATTDGAITTYRDATGKVFGSSSPSGSQILYRDVHGRLVATAEQSGSLTTYRDGRGQIFGTATADGSQITYRDHKSRIVGTATFSEKMTTYRDASGKFLGTVSSGKNNDFTRDAFFHVWISAKGDFGIRF